VVIPIVGGLIGLRKCTKWGGFHSIMGQILLALSVSMIIWGIALGMWTYYFAIGIALPYPSAADYIFIWSPILWVYALIQLSRVVGAPFALRTGKEKVMGVVTTFVMALLSYYLLVVIAHSNTLGTPEETALQLFFDYAYTLETLVTVILVGTVFSFSRNYLGGKYRNPVLFLFLGFFIHFLAICFFVLTTSNATYFNGNIADILFTLAVYFECLGIINLDPRLIDG
jgi:hypothetical protein